MIQNFLNDNPCNGGHFKGFLFVKQCCLVTVLRIPESTEKIGTDTETESGMNFKCHFFFRPNNETT